MVARYASRPRYSNVNLETTVDERTADLREAKECDRVRGGSRRVRAPDDDAMRVHANEHGFGRVLDVSLKQRDVRLADLHLALDEDEVDGAMEESLGWAAETQLGGGDFEYIAKPSYKKMMALRPVSPFNFSSDARKTAS